MAESDSASRHGQFRALMGGVGAGQRGAQRPPLLALHRSPASQTKDGVPHVGQGGRGRLLWAPGAQPELPTSSAKHAH